jgi:hypothetical protein
MLFSLSILLGWMISRLRTSRRAVALPESRTAGSGNPHGGTLAPRHHSH